MLDFMEKIQYNTKKTLIFVKQKNNRNFCYRNISCDCANTRNFCYHKENIMRRVGDDIDKDTLLTVLDSLNEAIYVIDKNERLRYANNAAAEIERIDRNWMIGKKVSEIYQYTDIDPDRNAPSLNVLHSGTSQIDENIEWFNKDGVMVNAITSSYPLFAHNSSKEIVGSYSVSEDIHKLRKRLLSLGVFSRKNTYRLRKQALKNGTYYVFDDIIHNSDAMSEMISMAKRFAAKKMPIMIYGETGTGKEMIAQSIHNASPQLSAQFVPINCAAIPENLLESLLFGTVKGAFTGATDNPGLFEKANGGTIFLDEINSMPITLQAKILRALQEKEVQRIGDNKIRKINCRFISATNKQPKQAIADGELREDLFYRLSTGMIYIPPLRERGKDLDLLLHYFIEKSNAEMDLSIERISDMLSSMLRSYQWPGNIRELANVIESMMNMTLDGESVLDVQHIPNYLKNHFFDIINDMPNAMQVFTHQNNAWNMRDQQFPVMNFNGSLSEMMGTYEKNILETALASTAGNLTRCGEKLGITRQGLMKKIKKYHIDLDKFKKK